MTDQLTLLRPIEAHKRFRIPRDRLYRAIKTGELPTLNFGTQKRPSYLIAVSDLLNWLSSLKVRSTTVSGAK